MALPKNIEPNQWKGGKCEEAFKNKSPQLRAHCYKSAEPLYRNGTVERVALFHYATKSEEDFKNKMQRGSGMSLRAKGYDYFNEIQKCALKYLLYWLPSIGCSVEHSALYHTMELLSVFR